MQIQVGDNTYEVDDSFEHLSPEQQDATIKEIQTGEQTHQSVQQETEQKDQGAAVPPGMFDVSNSQSGIRQYAIDPALAAISGGGDIAKQVISHPMGSAAAGVGASYIPGVNKLPVIRDIKTAREGLMNRVAPGAAVPPSAAPVQAAPTPVASVNPEAAANQQVKDWVVKGGQQKGLAPVTPVATAINGGTAAVNDGWIAKAIQSVGKYAEPVEAVAAKAAPALRGMSKLVAPLAIGSELFYTSPEEQKQLKELEAERRAKGWKPRNER